MKKLNRKLSIGFAATIIIYGIFFAYQTNFASSYDKNQNVKADSIYKQEILKINSEVIQSLGLRIEAMEKYVDASQKNLDLWLKLLSFILSVLIGFSVYSGLKSRELAKEELREVKEIKDSINRQASDAEDRLKKVTEQLTEIEKTATKTKNIEGELTKKLEEFSTKEEVVLNASQKKIIDDSIKQIKEELSKSGLESFKNLYLAKAIKAQSEHKWEDVVRLINSFNDFEENNIKALSLRSYAYFKQYLIIKDKSLLDKSLLDINIVINIDPSIIWSFEIRGLINYYLEKYLSSISDYSEAIRLDSKNARTYFNRALTFREMGKSKEEEADMIKAKELDPAIEEDI